MLSIFSCSRMTHVEVTIEAPYEFLHDVTYPTKQPFTSGYRYRLWPCLARDYLVQLMASCGRPD